MMFNIRTGHGNITRVRNEEIMIFVSSLHRIKRLGIPFVFTNQHAYPVTTEYFSDLENLDRIDWALLQSKDFKGDPDDPGKKERYQAEALVYKHLPLDGLDGVICCSTSVEEKIKLQICERGSTLKTGVQPQWFF